MATPPTGAPSLQTLREPPRHLRNGTDVWGRDAFASHNGASTTVYLAQIDRLCSHRDPLSTQMVKLIAILSLANLPNVNVMDEENRSWATENWLLNGVSDLLGMAAMDSENKKQGTSTSYSPAPRRRLRIDPEALARLARDLRAAQAMTPPPSPSQASSDANMHSTDDITLLVDTRRPSALPDDLSEAYHQVPLAELRKDTPAPPSPHLTTFSPLLSPTTTNAEDWSQHQGWEMVDEMKEKEEGGGEGDDGKPLFAPSSPSTTTSSENSLDGWSIQNKADSEDYYKPANEPFQGHSIPFSPDPNDATLINLPEPAPNPAVLGMPLALHSSSHHEICELPDPLYFHPRAFASEIEVRLPTTPPATPQTVNGLPPLEETSSDAGDAPEQHDDGWDWYVDLLDQVNFLSPSQRQYTVVFIQRNASYFAYTSVVQELTHRGRLATELGSTLPTWTALGALALSPTILHSPWATYATCKSFVLDLEAL